MDDPPPLGILLVIPTYNEAENIDELLAGILGHLPDAEVLFVDDDSPDGTLDRIMSCSERSPGRVHWIRRPRKLGLGTAYLAGFEWALERDYDAVVQMDADLSHDPADLPRLLAGLGTHDLVIGSRYVAGGGVREWSAGRRWLSRFASFYSRTILDAPIRDLTSGFNVWRRQVLEALELSTIRSEGYSFLIELKIRAHLAGAAVGEMPILFVDRRAGKSKLSRQVILEAVYRVWLLRFSRRSLAAHLKPRSASSGDRDDTAGS